ncbi:hypothetical protein FPANT_7531 [Fusarium pseudoanthophilum]|uniref:Uncharacterized protein n=1 Tax=Fusarium pseudoanthophilum TaxID=48495 RepID=A0A8H5L606_9HYPO|nr:hypothetical protein FPANT_7531 [Fusarium pseudoanthophilum]
MCADNSSTLICGQQVSSYAQGGSYGAQAGIRQCAKTKAILLWAVTNGHRPDHPQSWQNILEWCNYNHGAEFLNIIGKRLEKTVWYFAKLAASHQLNQDSFGSSIDGITEAEAWLARQKSLNDVEMKDADSVAKTDTKVSPSPITWRLHVLTPSSHKSRLRAADGPKLIDDNDLHALAMQLPRHPHPTHDT